MLSIEALEVRHGALPALSGVNLELPAGAILAVLGANGAGKTSLLRAISGVLVPRRGSIRLEGREIAGLAPEAIVRAGVCHVPEGRELFPMLTVRENLLMGAWIRNDANGIERDLARICADFPVLGERAQQCAGLLSGGEQQMLAIGRALMARPRLLILDEPSLGLAPRVARGLFAMIARERGSRGLTVLVAEHNARLALEHADIACVLELGRVSTLASPAQLLREDFVRGFLLGDNRGEEDTCAPRP
ncbi:MAG: ABC transporter ATP-binding protein [Rhodocyclaceae bacterium]